MKTQRSIVVMAALTVCLIGMLAFLHRSAEPTFRKKPLSYWVGELSSHQFAQSYDAIRGIGPRAVPFLLQKIRTNHATYRRIYLAVWPKLPASLGRRLPPPRPMDKTDEEIAQALSLVDKSGLPLLIAALNDRSSAVRRVAGEAIGKMVLTHEVVEQSAPVFGPLLADPDPAVRIAALSTLEKMGRDARPAVPALIQALQDASSSATNRVPGPGFRALSARVLGLVGPDARLAVPYLSNLVSAPDQDLRSQAAVAWWRITGDTNLVAVLTAELDRDGLLFSSEVVSALGEIGPAARLAAPVLVKQLKDPKQNSPAFPASFALDALHKIDPASATAIEREQEQARVSAFIQRALADHPELLRRSTRPVDNHSKSKSTSGDAAPTWP